ncbi:MAG: TetR/AcrR family transcriptional regulator [Acidimicrobiales bacterium]|nr:TetR/AcrR family transcriptional regulator [Acidimicrobiales bacterium]
MPNAELVRKRREQILKGASKVIAEKGYQETNISDIAKELGIGHGTFYRYFDNKRHIAEQVLSYAVDQVTQLIVDVDPEAANTILDYENQLKEIGSRLFDFFNNNRELAQVFFFEAYGVDRDLTTKLQEVIELFGTYVERYLQNGCQKGYLLQDLDIEITARAINGMIFAGVLRTFQKNNGEVERDRWIKSISALMLSGMAA